MLAKTDDGSLDYKGTLDNAKAYLAKNRPKLMYFDSNGKGIPGTTTVLNVLAKDALVPWAWGLGKRGLDFNKVRDESAYIGTIVHHYVECDAKGVEAEVDPAFGEENILKARKVFQTYLDWKIDNGFAVMASEIALANESYGGTLDLIGGIGKEFVGPIKIYDIKTSTGVYYSHLIQLGAYRRLYRETYGENYEASIIHLPTKLGGIRVINFSEADLDLSEESFFHCLSLYRHRKELEGIVNEKGDRRRRAKD